MLIRTVTAALALFWLAGAAPAFAEEHAPAEHADAAQGGEHGGGHGGGEELNFADFSYKDEHKNPPLLFALVNFCLLLALLGWKAVPALRSYWTKKSDGIRAGLEEGTRLRDEAEKKLEEYTARIKGVDAEVDALVRDIRAEAEAEKERILAEAEAQAKATRAATEARISAEIAAARRTIEREVVTAAVAAAEKILRAKVTQQDHQELVSGFVNDLDDRISQMGGPA